MALEAYYAQEGNTLGAAATETNLIQAGLLAGYSNNYNVVSGAVVAGDQVVVAAIPASGTLLAAPAAVAATTVCT